MLGASSPNEVKASNPYLKNTVISSQFIPIVVSQLFGISQTKIIASKYVLYANLRKI
jgi:hypothetical protein